MTNPQQFFFIPFLFIFKAHKAELFPEAPAFSFVKQQVVGRGSPGTYSCYPDRSNHRNIVAFCGQCTAHTQPDHCALQSLARPGPTAPMALGSLHVYSTYREGIYRGVGITQITLHFPRRKKKLWQKTAFTHSIATAPCATWVREGMCRKKLHAGLCNRSGASALAWWAQSPRQGHSGLHRHISAHSLL